MSEESSDRLIRELGADLTPVRLFPPLRFVLASIVVAWAAIGAVVLLWIGPRGDLAEMLAGDRVFGAVVLGLLLAGLGASAAALAAMVPGRESLRLAGATMAVSALAAAGVVCLTGSDAVLRGDPMLDLACIIYAALLGAPLVGWMSVRARQGFTMEPSRVAVMSLFGGVSMGALLVHLMCPAGAYGHFLAAHLGAGAVAAVVLALPLGLVLRRATE